MLYLFGGWIIHIDSLTTADTQPSTAQLIGAAIVAAGFIAVAFFARPNPHRPPTTGELPAAPDGLAATTILGWSRWAGWGQRHHLALASGAMMTYAWLGVVLSLRSTKTICR